MARPKSPPRVNGPYPDREGTRFRVRIFDRGHRKDLYFRSEAAAQDCIVQARRRISSAQGRVLAFLIDEYLQEKERLGRAQSETCKNQRERIRWFLSEYLEADVRALTSEQAALLYQRVVQHPSRKTGKPMAAASHRHYLALAKGFYAWALRTGHIDQSPFKSVPPVGRVSAGKPQLRIEEAQGFLDEALRRFDQRGDGLALGGAAALLMGLRASELLRRRARDVDRDGGILWIDQGKTRNARRFLDVPVILQARLCQLARSVQPEDLLFGAGRGGAPRVRQILWQAVQRICDAAEVPRVCPHSLRGLWATLGVQAGAVSHAVAASLGHGSFAMTERHYAQPEVVRGARTARFVERLNLGSLREDVDPSEAAAQLLDRLPPSVLDSLVSLLMRRRARSAAPDQLDEERKTAAQRKPVPSKS
jgi:integrase